MATETEGRDLPQFCCERSTLDRGGGEEGIPRTVTFRGMEVERDVLGRPVHEKSSAPRFPAPLAAAVETGMQLVFMVRSKLLSRVTKRDLVALAVFVLCCIALLRARQDVGAAAHTRQATVAKLEDALQAHRHRAELAEETIAGLKAAHSHHAQASAKNSALLATKLAAAGGEHAALATKHAALAAELTELKAHRAKERGRTPHEAENVEHNLRGRARGTRKTRGARKARAPSDAGLRGDWRLFHAEPLTVPSLG